MDQSNKALSFSEIVFVAALAIVLMVGWFGLVLVQLSSFRATYLAVLTGVALLGSALATAAFMRRGHLRLGRPKVGRDEIVVAALLLAGGVLFLRPAQHLPMLGEPSIYTNTAALLVRTGSLVNTYAPLTSLDAESRRLFYVPSTEQIPERIMTGYDGLLFGAFFVTDAARGEIAASRPPLFVIWMAILASLVGQEGMVLAAPVFAMLGVVAVYLAGKRLFDWRVGLVGSMLLTLSFPQVYYARTPYAEVFTQFLLFSSLFMTALSLDRRKVWGMGMAGVGFGEALQARVDTVFVVFPLAALVIVLLYRRRTGEALALTLSFSALAVQAGVYALTVNQPYMLGNIQLLQFRFGHLALLLTLSSAALGVGLSAALAFAFRAWLVRYGPRLRAFWDGRGSIAVALVVISLAVYAYYVRPEYVKVVYQWGSSSSYSTHDEDIVPRLAAYISPIAFWLGMFGFALLLRRMSQAKILFFVSFCAVYGFLFFGQQFVAPIYPVALRRQIPEVIPSLLLLAAFGLFGWTTQSVRLKWFSSSGVALLWEGLASRAPRFRLSASGGPLPGAAVAARREIGAFLIYAIRLSIVAFVAAGYVVVLWPYLSYTEAEGTGSFVGKLAERFDRSDIIIFDRLSDQSQVGWMASPLWALYGKETLLLSRSDVPPDALKAAVERLASPEGTVWFVSQSPEGPKVDGLSFGRPAWQEIWRSSLIGQSRDHFPAIIWRFEMPFYGYRVAL